MVYVLQYHCEGKDEGERDGIEKCHSVVIQW